MHMTTAMPGGFSGTDVRKFYANMNQDQMLQVGLNSLRYFRRYVKMAPLTKGPGREREEEIELSVLASLPSDLLPSIFSHPHCLRSV